QLNALKNLVELNDVNQQYKIIDIMLKGLFKVLEDSRQILVAANMRPDDPFPMDDKIKEDVTGAGNHREKSRLHQPYRTERDDVSHASMAPSALAPVQIGLFVAAGASHRRGVQEDPEGGREEAEEGGEEERNQERPSHLALPLGTLAPPPLEQVGRAGREEMGAHLQGASSVTEVCQVGTAEPTEDEDGQRRTRRVTVIDTPGYGNTSLDEEQTRTETAKCVSLSAPGPHAFLLVVPIGQYTASENQAVCELARMFGEDAVCHHTVVLLTRGDDLQGLEIEEYLRKAPAGLRSVIERCGGRYHVFNNRDPSNTQQVEELLRTVDNNGESTWLLHQCHVFSSRSCHQGEGGYFEEEGEEEEPRGGR
ncbi:unnamed protein product, partial [Tetraodon nigroviridis]